MAKRVRFKADRKALGDVMLRSDEVQAMLQTAAEAAAPEGTEVTTLVGKTRARATIYDESPRALSREAKEGHLTQALGQVHV